MKFFFTIVCSTFVLYSSAQRCGTVEYLNALPLNKYSVLRTETPKTANRDTLKDEVIVIPVVVHVL